MALVDRRFVQKAAIPIGISPIETIAAFALTILGAADVVPAFLLAAGTIAIAIVLASKPRLWRNSMVEVRCHSRF